MANDILLSIPEDQHEDLYKGLKAKYETKPLTPEEQKKLISKVVDGILPR